MGQKVVYITTDLLTKIIRQGAENHTRVVEGLPSDAKLVRIIPDYSVGWEVNQARLALVYESSEWPELSEGSVLPIQTIRFEAIRSSDV
jgi:hypothetical protein